MISTAELSTIVGPSKLDELLELDALTEDAKQALDAATAAHAEALEALESTRLQAANGGLLERTTARAKLSGLVAETEALAATLRTAQQAFEAASWKGRTLRDSLVHAHRRLQALDAENLPPQHREKARQKLTGILGLEQALELA